MKFRVSCSFPFTIYLIFRTFSNWIEIQLVWILSRWTEEKPPSKWNDHNSYEVRLLYACDACFFKSPTFESQQIHKKMWKFSFDIKPLAASLHFIFWCAHNSVGFSFFFVSFLSFFIYVCVFVGHDKSQGKQSSIHDLEPSTLICGICGIGAKTSKTNNDKQTME